MDLAGSDNPLLPIELNYTVLTIKKNNFFVQNLNIVALQNNSL